MKINCVFTNASRATSNKDQFGRRRGALGILLQLRTLSFNRFLVESILRFRVKAIIITTPFRSQRRRERNSVTEFGEEENLTLSNRVVSLGESHRECGSCRSHETQQALTQHNTNDTTN